MFGFQRQLNHDRGVALLAKLASVLVLCGCALTANTAIGAPQDAPSNARLQTEQKTKPQTSKQKKSGQTDEKQKPKKVSDTRVVELRGFVKEHHAEILPLIQHLEKSRPKRFDRVMYGLDREVRTLERIKTKNAKAYPGALSTWVNRSKLKLLAAQLKTASDATAADQIRAQMRDILNQNRVARLKQLERDLVESQAKQTRLENLISELKNGDEDIEKRINQLSKQAPKMNETGAGRKKKEPKKTPESKRDSSEKPAKDGEN